MIHFAKFEPKNVANIYKPTPYLNQRNTTMQILFLNPMVPDLASARPWANPLFHCYQEKMKQHYLVSI